MNEQNENLDTSYTILNELLPVIIAILKTLSQKRETNDISTVIHEQTRQT